MDWVQLSSAIEANQTPNFVWVRFRNQSNLSNKWNPIKLNPLDCVGSEFGTAELNQTQLNGLQKAAFLVAFYYTLEPYTAHLKPFLWNFFLHVHYPPFSSKIWLLIFNAFFYRNREFKIRTFAWVWLIFSFWLVRFCSIVKLIRTQSMNWVWFSSI